ncbi:cytochrome P450 [Neoconidiobolus thromboides FSU 785]|nr:cytochrome P450 [Neoconidiobolus thromboides FSU 785]
MCSLLKLIRYSSARTDTTSDSLTWLFYLLYNYPEIYKNDKEMFIILSDDNSITYTKCESGFHYLNAAIHESLKILPLVGGITIRYVFKEGIVIDKYYIPESLTRTASKNSQDISLQVTVGVNVNGLHNLPSQWKNPSQFNPQR